MKTWITKVVSLVVVLASAVPVAEAARKRPVRPLPGAIEIAATQAAQSAMAAGVPGVEIAVSKGGHIIYSGVFGVTDKDTAAAVTARSVMQIGSVTKQFTAAAILRLAERGALTLDDPIEKHVPEFNPRGETITLRHLLGHRSGIPSDWHPPSSSFPLHSPVTRQQVISGINGQPFDFKPGSQWRYSNGGYMLAGYAVESVSGKPYAEFIHSEFALPLGLLDTGVCGTFNLPVPEGYGVTKTGGWRRMQSFHSSGVIGDGSLCSTASDLALWSHKLATGQVMLPATYATMTTRTAPTPLYGLGLDLRKMVGHPAVSHGGSIDGFQTYLIYFPQKEIAVAVIINVFPTPTNNDDESIAFAVASAALGAV